MVKQTLPNGMEIYHLNKTDTDHLFNSIFVEEAYFQNGIIIKNDDIIFDIGSNIGLFTLYIASHLQKCQIYCLEPITEIFNVLELNVNRINKPGIDIKLFNQGISDKNREMDFIYYPNLPSFSGCCARKISIEDNFKYNVYQKNKDKFHDELSLTRLTDFLSRNRFLFKQNRCRVETMSDIIERFLVPRIDLLKIDVEGSEFHVLEGIKDEHYNSINQIVAEIHDVTNDSTEVKNLLDNLKDKGYDVIMAPCSYLFNYYLYARKTV